MNPRDIDMSPFPNVGNNPFYNKEFSIGSMLPQINLTDNNIICRGVRPYANEPKYTFDLLDEINLEPIQEATGDTKKYPVYIMLMHSGTALSNAIKGFTHSEFSHSSISFDETMTNMYSFGRKADFNPFIGGFKQEDIHGPFFQTKDIPYALYVVPCTPNQINLMKQRLEFFTKNQSKFKYDFTGLLKNYFGIVDNPEYRWFCSRFVADIINSGYPTSQPIKNPNLVRPEDFKNMQFATYVTGGNLKDYNPAKVKQIANKIINSQQIIESSKERINDKGESVPEVCPKCGSKIGVYLRGEPVYLCSSKECGKYFGTLPCNITEATSSWPSVTAKETPSENKNDSLSKKAVDIVFYNSDNEKIGEASVSSIDTDTPYAYNIEVYSKFRGQHYGHSIMDYLMNKYKVAELSVKPDNEVAINLYKKHGFKVRKSYEWNKEKLLDMVSSYWHESVSEAVEDFVTESWLLIQDDFKINMDQWKPGNPLWITGASGDGKSTLTKKMAEKYHAKIVTSDIVLVRIASDPANFMRKLNKAKDTHNMAIIGSPALDYVDSNPNLPWGARDPITKSWDSKIIEPEMIKFYYWFMNESSKNPKYKNNLYIIEGCDICLLDPNIMATKPLLIVGGSRLRSLWRRSKRDAEEKNKFILQSVFKYIRNYNISNRNLDDHKEIFRQSIEDILNESVNRSELPDSVFGIPEERKYPMPDEHHTRSAMKLFNHCEKKYEEELAKHIIKNIKKYHIDPSFVGPKNRLRKYLIKANLITEGVNTMEDTNHLLDKMMYEFFGDTTSKSDADILFEKYFGEASKSEDIKCVPDKIEPMVKKLENKKYRVKYASPGHSNTTFDNDKNKDGVVNGKLVSTGRIIFERDYHFDGTPEGWQWKKLENGFRALYVKPFTYNGADGHEKEAFHKWQNDYLDSLNKWIESLPMMDSENPRNKPEEDEDSDK